MPLTRLSLTDFRSYADLLLEPGPGLVILTGENGAGKTNILEAVSLLAPGRGLRGATLTEMARTPGPGGFGVAAHLSPLPVAGGAASQTRGGTGRASPAGAEDSHPAADAAAPPASGRGGAAVTLGTGTLAAAPERRQVRINAAPAAANALAEWLSVLWLTPIMDRLFTDSPGGRRRFLDRLTLALDAAHAVHAARYEAAMRARNKLLTDDAPADPEWLSALEARMAEHGAAIEQARSAAVSALAGRLAAAPEGPFARARIAMEGGGPDRAAKLAQLLREGRARDAAAGRTLTGPHRADLLVTHAGKDQPAGLCSTGEQKALLLNLILAHADLVRRQVSGTGTGRPLILLLDEVAAHLDPTRRAALFERLGETGSQVWMTGTEATLFEGAGPSACWYRVQDGAVQPS